MDATANKPICPAGNSQSPAAIGLTTRQDTDRGLGRRRSAD